MSSKKTTYIEKLAARLIAYYERQQCILRVIWHLKGDTPPGWLKLALPAIWGDPLCRNSRPAGEFYDDCGESIPEMGDVSPDMDIFCIIQSKNARGEKLVAIPLWPVP